MITMIDLKNVSQKVIDQLQKEIDEFSKAEFDDSFRNHLGASLIGNECSRYLWYIFRWCFNQNFSGRMLRLFNRGHLEEKRFESYLKGLGCQVFTVDKKGEQFRINGVFGHFGGSIDGVCKLPIHYEIDEFVLLEMKTINDKGFNNLKRKKLILANPTHYAQICTYGKNLNLKHCLYMSVNKNTDEIYLEIVPIDHNNGAQMELKAERIIMSQEPPPRLSNNPNYKNCNWCSAKDLCHNNKPVVKNCRSCKHCTPSENKSWFCYYYNDNVPKEFILKGCEKHESINLVNDV